IQEGHQSDQRCLGVDHNAQHAPDHRRRQMAQTRKARPVMPKGMIMASATPPKSSKRCICSCSSSVACGGAVLTGSVVGVRSNRTGASVAVGVMVGGGCTMSIGLGVATGWTCASGVLTGEIGLTTGGLTVIVSWVVASPPGLRTARVYTVVCAGATALLPSTA